MGEGRGEGRCESGGVGEGGREGRCESEGVGEGGRVVVSLGRESELFHCLLLHRSLSWTRKPA